MGGPRQPAEALACGRFRLALDRPLVMGVINVTPDSFSDLGSTAGTTEAIAHARRLAGEGADILDIGARVDPPGRRPRAGGGRTRSDRAGARRGGRARPAGVGRHRRPEVMRAALAAGADMINDVGGFRAPGAIEAVAGSAAALCVMHMRGEPATMQDGPAYRDVVADVREFLFARTQALYAAGVAPDRIVLDPGIGFGKSLEDNLRLLRAIDRTLRDRSSGAGWRVAQVDDRATDRARCGESTGRQPRRGARRRGARRADCPRARRGANARRAGGLAGSRRFALSAPREERVAKWVESISEPMGCADG